MSYTERRVTALWSQTRSDVTVRMRELGTGTVSRSDVSVICENNNRIRVNIKTSTGVIYDEVYDLFSSIDCNRVAFELKRDGREIEIKLPKPVESSIWWERLLILSDKASQHKVKIDWDRWIDEDDIIEKENEKKKEKSIESIYDDKLRQQLEVKRNNKETPDFGGRIKKFRESLVRYYLLTYYLIYGVGCSITLCWIAVMAEHEKVLRLIILLQMARLLEPFNTLTKFDLTESIFTRLFLVTRMALCFGLAILPAPKESRDELGIVTFVYCSWMATGIVRSLYNFLFRYYDKRRTKTMRLFLVMERVIGNLLESIAEGVFIFYIYDKMELKHIIYHQYGWQYAVIIYGFVSPIVYGYRSYAIMQEWKSIRRD